MILCSHRNIRSPPTILTSSRESLSSVMIVLISAFVSNVDTWRRSPSFSGAPISHKKTHFTVQPLSLTARICFCPVTAAFCSVSVLLFQNSTMKFPVFCSLITSKFDYHSVKNQYLKTALRDLENSYMRFVSAKETMHKHYFYIKAFDDYVFISLKLIACRFCLF